VISEIHAGGEYPFDARSGIDCLHGLAVLYRLLPAHVLTKPRTQLMVSTGNRPVDLDENRYQLHLTMLRNEYERMVRADPALESDICAVTDFWRRLRPDEHDDVINVAGAFETPQRGVDPDTLAAVMIETVAESGVDVRLSHEVRAVVRRGKGAFRVFGSTRANDFAFDCSQIAFANHIHGFAMMNTLADDHFVPPTAFVGRRMIALVEYGSERPFPSPTRLMLEGDFGAMEAPLGRNRSLVYYPPVSHLSSIRLDPPYALPPTWRNTSDNAHDIDCTVAERLIAGAANVAYPYLAGSRIVEPKVAFAVNSVANSRVRRNFGVLKPCDDCISLTFNTKATTTAINAARAASLLVGDVEARRGRELRGIPHSGTRPRA
jgi:hypothetical protein